MEVIKKSMTLLEMCVTVSIIFVLLGNIIEFLLGHVDNTRTGRGKLRVSYLENGKSIEAEAVELSDGIPKTKYSIPIHNTSTVTIEFSAVGTDFGLADIYLVK